jgi:hypothetical protein
MYTKFWLENLKRTDHSEDLSVDRRIILEWINWIGSCRLDSFGSGQGPVVDL